MVDFLLPPSGSRRGTIPTDDLVAALEGELGGGSPQILIFDTTEAAGGNRYATWATLYAAITTARGNGVHGGLIVVRSTSAAPASIPAGSYNLAGWALVGDAKNSPTGYAHLNLTDAVFTEVPWLWENLLAAFTGACSTPGGAKLHFRGCYLATQDNPLTDEAYVVLERTVIDGSAQPFFDGSTNIVMSGGSCIGNGALAGVTHNIVLLDTNSVIGSQPDAAAVNKQAPSLPGGLTPNYNDANASMGILAARFGPWRHSYLHDSGATQAQLKERVLVDGNQATLEVTTPANPNPGDTFSVKEVMGGTSLNLTVTATSGTVESPGTLGTSGASAVFALGAGECITWEWFDSNWYVVSKLG